ncbi:hypothetical protein N8E89_26130 (plasmid) [Phyllobacterium sp. A18/5-2]|nr:hypothetical protein [Phyllobacterium sp. A18/5-2]UXN66569.1 hypothetical protein N8E89_26130 [Phyllobacterium sp. A18/5-2]
MSKHPRCLDAARIPAYDDVIIAIMAAEQEMTETGIENDNNSSAS